MFSVNVDGVFNTILPLLERFKNRKAGQIAVVSSLSGALKFAPRTPPARLPLPFAHDAIAFIDRAHSPSYQASKAAINTYLRALRGAMSAYNVRVSTICPGFVETAFTAVTRSQVLFEKAHAQCSWPAQCPRPAL